MGNRRSFSTCLLLLRADGFAAVPSSCRAGALHFLHPRVRRCHPSEQVIDLAAKQVLRKKAGMAQSFVQIAPRFIEPHGATLGRPR